MNTIGIINNNYFKDHDTFKKYPELFITDEYISYIDSLNVKQRLKLLEEYQQNTLLLSDLTTRGYVDFNLHPEILYQECLIVYGSYLEFPENFYESRKKKLPYIHYRIKGQIDFKKKAFYNFMNGNVYSLKEKFGFNPYTDIQKALDYIFEKKEVTFLLKSEKINSKTHIECRCNKIDCPYRTETCYKWGANLLDIFMGHSKSKECGIYMKQEKLRVPEKIVKERLKEIYGDSVLLESNYVEVQSPAVFRCNRIYCKNFDKCFSKRWTSIVNRVLRRECPNPRTCKMYSNSYGELFISEILFKLNIEFISQKTFKTLVYKGSLRFDFYLPKYNTCIEYQGEQHFDLESFKKFLKQRNTTKTDEEIEKSFKELQKRDQMKKDFCKENSINFLEIKYNEPFENIKNIIQEFLKTKRPF